MQAEGLGRERCDGILSLSPRARQGCCYGGSGTFGAEETSSLDASLAMIMPGTGHGEEGAAE